MCVPLVPLSSLSSAAQPAARRRRRLTDAHPRNPPARPQVARRYDALRALLDPSGADAARALRNKKDQERRARRRDERLAALGPQKKKRGRPKKVRVQLEAGAGAGEWEEGEEERARKRVKVE